MVQDEELRILNFSNMNNFTKEGFSVIKESIKYANDLPLSDFDFFNMQQPFKNIMRTESNRVLKLMNNILKNYGIKNNFKTSSSDFKEELLVEMNDTILEKVGDCIDEINGIKKYNNNIIESQTSHTRINGSWNRVNNTKLASNISSGSQADTPSSVLKLLTVKDIKRPQESFVERIDNSNDHPWEPKIKEKPNSLKPLAIFLEETERGEEFSHPYEFELEKFSAPEDQLLPDDNEAVFPKPLEQTTFIEVDTEEKLLELVEDLRKYKLIAIDLEHHSYRTFMGITCLMQISTGDTDYIIDTLILRNKLHVLNEIFTKPSILKIFHGADSDILWLQRDLSLYIVNMFDTYQAAKMLGNASLSLASLLERFCNFTPNKHFQMADWRMRPLPDALKKYAREDTHYLIYIYKMMKIELLKKSNCTNNLLKIVYDRSTETCKKRFFKQRCTENSSLDFYGSCKRMFDKRQLYALKEIYNWRDRIAREADESIGYVLPGHMLLQISETLPREMQGILACCNPVPTLVRSNLLELHQIILKARDVSVDQPILQEDTRARGTMIEKQKIDLDNPFYSPFDSSKKESSRENIPVLLEDEEYDTRDILKKEDPISIATPIFSLFVKEQNKLEKPARNFRLLIPYERYSCVKLFLQNEEKQKQAQLIKEQEDIKPDIPAIIEIEEDVEKIYENLDNLTDENKTEEQRMASLSNHFTLLSQKTKEDVETEKRLEERLYQKASSLITERTESLMEMGGSRKRRREESDEEESEDEELEEKLLNPAPEHIKTEKGTTPTNSKSKYNKKRQNRQDFHRNESYTPNLSRDHNRKRKSGEASSPNYESKKNKSNRSQEGNNFQNKKQDDGNNSNIEPFDYSSVDFRQFQGGAGEVNKGKVYKSKFKNKRNSKTNTSQKWGKRQ